MVATCTVDALLISSSALVPAVVAAVAATTAVAAVQVVEVLERGHPVVVEVVLASSKPTRATCRW
jgi:hypothetical protein